MAKARRHGERNPDGAAVVLVSATPPAPLALFAAPPRVIGEPPMPAPLFGDALPLPLTFAAASSSDAAVAAARIKPGGWWRSRRSPPRARC